MRRRERTTLAGANNIKVTSVANISAGDKIRLDVDSLGHGIETVIVTRVGSPAKRTNLAAPAEKGATSIRVRDAHEFAAGDVITIGTSPLGGYLKAVGFAFAIASDHGRGWQDPVGRLSDTYSMIGASS